MLKIVPSVKNHSVCVTVWAMQTTKFGLLATTQLVLWMTSRLGVMGHMALRGWHERL